MSDVTETLDAPSDEAPAPDPAPDTEQAPAAEDKPETFDREYVEKLRHEAAGRRTATDHRVEPRDAEGDPSHG